MRWNDLVRGPQHIDEASQRDPVLVRADRGYLYSFTSVVDDIAFGISHVIRGEDHVTNSRGFWVLKNHRRRGWFSIVVGLFYLLFWAMLQPATA